MSCITGVCLTDNDLGVHSLTSSVELGSGAQQRNSSRAISTEVILSRARACWVCLAQCSPSMARLKSARAIRRCCSCFTDSNDSPWLWHGWKHQHKCWKSDPTQKLKHMHLIKHAMMKPKGSDYGWITVLHFTHYSCSLWISKSSTICWKCPAQTLPVVTVTRSNQKL